MHSDSFRRRDFFTLFGGAATIWSLGARAQQAGRVKQIGILTGAAKNELTQSQVRALEFGLQELGWFDGRNLRIEYRWAGGDPDRIHAFAKEIVALTPDLIVGVMTPVVAALKQQTRTIPIVFVGISDPVRSEFVEASHDPAAISPDSPFTKQRWAANGCSFSTSSRLLSSVSRCCSIRRLPTRAQAAAYICSRSKLPRMPWARS